MSRGRVRLFRMRAKDAEEGRRLGSPVLYIPCPVGEDPREAIESQAPGLGGQVFGEVEVVIEVMRRRPVKREALPELLQQVTVLFG